MKIALIQLNIIWENKVENLKNAKKFIKQASLDKCDLIVFPEMFNTGFSMNSKAIAETKECTTFKEISSYAKEFNINIITGFALKSEPLPQNVAVYINNLGELKAQYTKNYPFSFAGEDQHYSSGKESVIFELKKNINASLFICYDLRFPELFRTIAKKVDMIFVIANWPKKRQAHWQSLLKARAIENQCFIIGINRIGTDANGLEYSGGSLVISPWGEELLNGAQDQEYLVLEIDENQAQEIRSKFPFLKDMRE